jgi:hypothetical protein
LNPDLTDVAAWWRYTPQRERALGVVRAPIANFCKNQSLIRNNSPL